MGDHIPHGKFFDQERLGDDADKITTMQDFVTLFDIIEDDDYKYMFDITNNRVYKAFEKIDQVIIENRYTRRDGSSLPSDWAPKYKAWLIKHLADVENKAWEWMTETVQILKSKNVRGSLTTSQNLQIAGIEKHRKYDRSAFRLDFDLSWIGSPPGLQKRQIIETSSALSNRSCKVISHRNDSAAATGSATRQNSQGPEGPGSDQPSTIGQLSNQSLTCHSVVYSPSGPCPHAYSGYCNCSDIIMPSRGKNPPIDCEYKVQPGKNSCPDERHGGESLASVLAAAAQAQAASASAYQVQQASIPTLSPAPVEVSYNNDGSSSCNHIRREDCQNAYRQYNPGTVYHSYTSYIAFSGASFINILAGGGLGCTAKFNCKDQLAFDDGMTGSDILAAFDHLYIHDDVGICGTSTLSNGCSVSLDMCDGCQTSIPCDALDVETLQAGFPCY